MRLESLKIGDRVRDRWYPFEIYGRVTEVLKTRVKFTNGHGSFTYDRAHCDHFLEYDNG